MRPAIGQLIRSCAVPLLLVATPLFAQSALTPEQLTVRVERLTELSQRSEAKLSAVQAELKALSGEMERLGRQVDNRAVMEMIEQVDQISDDLNFLRGELEVQGNELAEIKKRQRELYQDVDRRLRDLESRTVTQAPASQATTPSTSGSGQTVAGTTGAASSSGETPSLQGSSESAGSASTSGSGSSSSGTTAAAAGSGSVASLSQSPTYAEEKLAYQAAFDTLKEGRYKEAKVELGAFLKQYPQSSFAGNAQYWLGEAHYVTRNFEQGIVEFKKVLSTYPGSNKVPDAMLKLGYTYYELKQYPESKAVLEDLRTRFPEETAARLASKRLERIAKEGN